MPLDLNKIVAFTFLTLISGSATASTIESHEFSLFPDPGFLVPPWIAKDHRTGTDNKHPIKPDLGKVPDDCPSCTGNDSDPNNALVPVTDFLSFAATADPQINKNPNHPRVAFQNDIARFLLTKLYNDSDYQGLIIAGDLTERTDKWEILKLYNSVLDKEESDLAPILAQSKQLDRLYEGLGNHDMRKGTCCVGKDVADNCICERGLVDIISRGDRRDQKSSQPPHYSWEWDGIRFIQLNLLPGDEAETVWNGSGRDPQDALKFLKNELKDAGPDKNVIIVHHYGMDRFSRKWWSIETKEAYKEAISDYRVVAIITGHLHWTRRASNMQQCWNDITAVTVGSIRLGFHLDFKITNDHLTVTRMRNGSPRWSDSYSIGQNDTKFCGDNT